MNRFLEASPFIDWRHPAVAAKAAELAAGCDSDEAVARRCFTFVRDAVRHSWDSRVGPVTCRASEVLAHATGYCYAKSHLLAALLRANAIPAGLCYQRLTVDSEGPPYCLHGLNAVYLKDYGWYRIDARGNRPDVAAEFTPPVEKLAFTLRGVGEKDFPGIRSSPLPEVVRVLTECRTIEEVYEHLPDTEVLPVPEDAP